MMLKTLPAILLSLEDPVGVELILLTVWTQVFLMMTLSLLITDIMKMMSVPFLSHANRITWWYA